MTAKKANRSFCLVRSQLLANGAAALFGMATSIPPHNAGEVCAGRFI